MWVRSTALAAMIALAGCAGVESVGRNAQRGTAPPPPAARTAPPPAVTAPAPTPAPAAAPAIVTPPPSAQLPPPRAQTTAPAPSASPPSQVATVTPPPQQRPAPPPVAAPRVTVPTPAPSTPASTTPESDDAIVVPGQRETQVQPPNGDPRSRIERMEDVRSWDQCVTQVQSAFERDPMRPQMDTPEDYCSRTLGMRDRLAVPDSRRR